MEVTAFIMGICLPNRLDWLKRTIDSCDLQNFPFTRKIIAIDQFLGYTFPENLKDEFTKKGWDIIIDSHQSRSKTMDHILNIDTEYLFYHEDDVIINFPTFEDVKKVFDINVDGRQCGIISLTVGGSDWIVKDNNYGDISLINENILLENDNYLFFKRLEAYKNDFFFEFPGLFIRTDLFKKCHTTVKNNNQPVGIEAGLSNAYFENNIHKDFFKCCVVKPGFLEALRGNVGVAMSNFRLLHNLDKNQGSQSFNGTHYPSAHNYNC